MAGRESRFSDLIHPKVFFKLRRKKKKPKDRSCTSVPPTERVTFKCTKIRKAISCTSLLMGTSYPSHQLSDFSQVTLVVTFKLFYFIMYPI
jgi:hypothetical protein